MNTENEKIMYTENEKNYMENADIDNAVMFREIKRLNEKVDALNSKVEPKTDAQKRDEIMAIKDSQKRLKAIEENIDLFKSQIGSGKYK